MISLIAALAAGSALPDISRLTDLPHKPTITYLDQHGAVLGVRGGMYGGLVKVKALPSYVPGAFVAIEDRRFYEHAGVDPIGIARALAADLAHGRIVEGASTITQQLARNLFLTPDQTLERKAQEMMLAVELERRYTKEEILGLYLSRVYFGSGAYGLEAAARRFFDTSADHLSIAQAALLAGLLKSPTNYNPIDHPDRAAERAKLVLLAMEDTGVITASQRQKALLHPASAKTASANAAAQYFVDYVDGETRRMVGAPAGDLVVETTLDNGLEGLAASAISETVARERAKGVEEAALVSLDGSGRIRAFVGGVDYAKSPFDRAVQAHRQAGSAWKPFVYLTALEAGRAPDTEVIDEPVTIGSWSPKNYEPGYLGPITLKTALIHSVNTVAARLADEVGRDAVARTARRMGVTSAINTDPAMALGTTLVTPIEMAQAYVPFANGGKRANAYAVERIRTAQGRMIYQHRADPPVVALDNPALGEMDDMLRGVVAEGTGIHAAIPGYDIAGKTGTTSDYKDAWFCGFTGDFATVVWLGRDDGTSMHGVTGGSAPARLWRAYMAGALPRVRPPAIPPGTPPALPAAVMTDAMAPSDRAPQDPVTDLLGTPRRTTDIPPSPDQRAAPRR